MKNFKRPVGNVALSQAMRFEFGMSYKKMAKVLNVAPVTAWCYCNKDGIQSWEDRSNREEAINKVKNLMSCK